MSSTRVQYHLPLPHREALGAEDFLVAGSNESAARYALETDLAAWPANALVFYGPAGVGKTHLLSAWAERVGARRLEPSDKIMEALVSGAVQTPLALDGADRVAGDQEAEEWLQHLYNAAAAARLRLLMTARHPPKSWGLGLADILSRLNSCPAIEIAEPDDALLRAMLLKQFADRQLLVEEGVIEYLARRLDRTGAAVREAVQTLDAKALESRRKISVPLAQTIFGEQA